MHILFFLTACVSIFAVVLICVFLFANGIPAIGKIGVFKFLLGTKWKPGNDIYGILPMILGSLYVTAGAIIIGVPIGLLTAVFLAKFCPKGLYKILKPATELMAGVPSVVYGFFGLVVLVPLVQNIFGVAGNTMLTASVLLGIMILPTIIGVSESAIRAVPDSYYEGSLALGASHERSVFFATLPSARSGILAGVVLGIGRAIGETMAVVMVAGNKPRMPQGLLDGVRTMTANIVMEMGYATDLHREALIATAVVLFVFILMINVTFSLLRRKDRA
ncbi:phosphate ABC transporter permease subunit PstC [Hominenteromicrobium sp.]|uniref:phosphate ABC transporter permease subunit PstC n=1 Tax=Hominenteromicrobium sp. TaxID=3073581 RepID=UPI003AF161B1